MDGVITTLVLKAVFEAIKEASISHRGAKEDAPVRVHHPCINCNKPVDYSCFKCGEYK